MLIDLWKEDLKGALCHSTAERRGQTAKQKLKLKNLLLCSESFSLFCS